MSNVRGHPFGMVMQADFFFDGALPFRGWVSGEDYWCRNGAGGN